MYFKNNCGCLSIFIDIKKRLRRIGTLKWTSYARDSHLGVSLLLCCKNYYYNYIYTFNYILKIEICMIIFVATLGPFRLVDFMGSW